eukprot:SAG22_NODE_1068_length_5742_cov_3.600390_7_plen_63_part_00
MPMGGLRIALGASSIAGDTPLFIEECTGKTLVRSEAVRRINADALNDSNLRGKRFGECYYPM